MFFCKFDCPLKNKIKDVYSSVKDNVRDDVKSIIDMGEFGEDGDEYELQEMIDNYFDNNEVIVDEFDTYFCNVCPLVEFEKQCH